MPQLLNNILHFLLLMRQRPRHQLRRCIRVKLLILLDVPSVYLHRGERLLRLPPFLKPVVDLPLPHTYRRPPPPPHQFLPLVPTNPRIHPDQRLHPPTLP